MKVLVFLGTALLFTLVFADHHGGHHKKVKDDHHHHDQKDDHDKKGEHHHHNESLPCHKIADYNSKFSFDLFRQVALDQLSENIVFSPVSISTAFAFVSLGAKAQTHSQIIEGLRFNTSEISEQEIHEGFHNLLLVLNDVDRELQLRSGNALFISKEQKILQTFLDEAKKFYHSEAFSTDFKNTEEAKNQINSYVDKKTQGKIPELVDSVDEDVILVLINYIYFKGKWEKPFQEELTEDRYFHVNENTTVKVPFMNSVEYYDVAFNNEATMVSLPYKGDVKALFILPKKGKLSALEQNYNKEAINKWKKSMRNRIVDLYLPKFSVSGTVNLKDTLIKMGIKDVFSDKADLSRITEIANIKISKALHKSVLTVNEKGAEGAGATMMEFVPRSHFPTVEFNHPFIFLMYDYKSRNVLFTGRIANPKE